MLCGTIVAGLAGIVASDPATPRGRSQMPAITRPVLFGTPEADKILAAFAPSGRTEL